jgi:HSP20 family protein
LVFFHVEVEHMAVLMRTDPFREFDRLAQQIMGTAAHPAAMPMDAWRDGDKVVIEFDLPGVAPDAVDLDVERNVLTVRAERPALQRSGDVLAAERPRGVFSRQLVLGENLDVERVEADYTAGVLRLTIPVAEKAKPRKISISSGQNESLTDSGKPHTVIEGSEAADDCEAVLI